MNSGSCRKPLTFRPPPGAARRCERQKDHAGHSHRPHRLCRILSSSACQIRRMRRFCRLSNPTYRSLLPPLLAHKRAAVSPPSPSPPLTKNLLRRRRQPRRLDSPFQIHPYGMNTSRSILRRERLQRLQIGATIFDLSKASGLSMSTLSLAERGLQRLSREQEQRRRDALDQLAGGAQKAAR